MAKGNIGNILQHFLALRCAEGLVEGSLHQNGQLPTIVYIDPFAMAPWEPIEGRQSQGFVSTVRLFPELRNDDVIHAFTTAWSIHYSERGEPIPEEPEDRDYPNTGVLLRVRFPVIPWDMRLCEVDPRKRAELERWAEQQEPGTYSVDRDWRESQILSEVDPDHSTLIVLDPYRIVADDSRNAGSLGYLTPTDITNLLDDRLRVLGRAQDAGAAPALVLLLSYADRKPDEVDLWVRSLFDARGWWTDRVRVGPFQGRQGAAHHQAWISGSTETAALAEGRWQSEWTAWRRMLRDAREASRRRLFSDLTFYRQGRVDGAIRTGVETPDQTLFDMAEHEPSPEMTDPTLLWVVEIRFNGRAVPRTPGRVQGWLSERAEMLWTELARVADEIDVGVDSDIYPLRRVLPMQQDDVEITIVISATRRRQGLAMGTVVRSISSQWGEITTALWGERPARV